MKKIFSIFLLATVLTTGFCPSIMAATEISSCHEMEVEMKDMEQESFTCDHIDFFDDTLTQQYFDFPSDIDIINLVGVINFQQREEYKIPLKILPQTDLIPPPREWEKQKQTVVIQV